jgi:hypothetical protein
VKAPAGGAQQAGPSRRRGTRVYSGARRVTVSQIAAHSDSTSCVSCVLRCAQATRQRDARGETGGPRRASRTPPDTARGLWGRGGGDLLYAGVPEQAHGRPRREVHLPRPAPRETQVRASRAGRAAPHVAPYRLRAAAQAAPSASPGRALPRPHVFASYSPRIRLTAPCTSASPGRAVYSLRALHHAARPAPASHPTHTVPSPPNNLTTPQTPATGPPHTAPAGRTPRRTFPTGSSVARRYTCSAPAPCRAARVTGPPVLWARGGGNTCGGIRRWGGGGVPGG